jgi:hypothetical protein
MSLLSTSENGYSHYQHFACENIKAWRKRETSFPGFQFESEVKLSVVPGLLDPELSFLTIKPRSYLNMRAGLVCVHWCHLYPRTQLQVNPQYTSVTHQISSISEWKHLINLAPPTDLGPEIYICSKGKAGNKLVKSW